MLPSKSTSTASAFSAVRYSRPKGRCGLRPLASPYPPAGACASLASCSTPPLDVVGRAGKGEESDGLLIARVALAYRLH